VATTSDGVPSERKVKDALLKLAKATELLAESLGHVKDADAHLVMKALELAKQAEKVLHVGTVTGSERRR